MSEEFLSYSWCAAVGGCKLNPRNNHQVKGIASYQFPQIFPNLLCSLRHKKKIFTFLCFFCHLFLLVYSHFLHHSNFTHEITYKWIKTGQISIVAVFFSVFGAASLHFTLSKTIKCTFEPKGCLVFI